MTTIGEEGRVTADGCVTGDVSSTSKLVTQFLPQHTDRMRLWFAALRKGTSKRYTTKRTTVNAVPTPPATSV